MKYPYMKYWAVRDGFCALQMYENDNEMIENDNEMIENDNEMINYLYNV